MLSSSQLQVPQLCVGICEKAHWDNFTKDICKLFSNLPDPNISDIDDANCQFTSAIIKMAKQPVQRGHRSIHISGCPGWDNECDDLAENTMPPQPNKKNMTQRQH